MATVSSSASAANAHACAAPSRSPCRSQRRPSERASRWRASSRAPRVTGLGGLALLRATDDAPIAPRGGDRCAAKLQHAARSREERVRLVVCLAHHPLASGALGLREL